MSGQDGLRERIAQALYVEHSRRYGVALARWSECHPSYYADADAVIAALGLVDEECQCGAGITHRDEHHRQSVCVRASGHSGAHDDGQGCVWTGGNHGTARRAGAEHMRAIEEGWDT